MSRPDGRKNDELRKMKATIGSLKNAEGSGYFALGKTKAVAGLFGPREVHPRHQEEPERAILRCSYNMAAFSTETRNRPGYSRRSVEISFVMDQALSSVVFLEDHPKTAIDVYVEVLEANASTRCVAINAASLALADAGVPMSDIVSSCAAGKVN